MSDPRDTQPGLPGHDEVAGGREIGPYRIVRQLGRGGMGIVYLAEHREVNRRVALKVLAAHHAASEKAVERFEREIRAVARLRDPNIVPIFDVGRVQGVPYFTMEYVEGVTLHDVLQGLRTRGARVENLSGRDLFDSTFAVHAAETVAPSVRGSWVHAACHIVAKIADALSHVHAQGVIHRDVKPKNVLLAHDGRVLLFDFGLARVETEAAMTVTGEFLGTPFYVSPEQLDPPATGIDERADIYSLGVTLYEMITLQVPFDGDSPQQIFKRIATRAARPPRRVNLQVPKDLETVCLVAMARERSRRYPGAADFAADLRRFLDLRPVFARPAGPLQRVTLWARRKPTTAAAIVLASVLVLALAANWRQRGVIAAERHALALASFQTAQLLAQQGRFRAAMVELEEARAGGHDPVAIEIARIEALEATGLEREALAALIAVRQRRDLGGHLGAVQLLAADLGADRLRDADAGLDLAQQALDSGTLARADAAYARALLAGDAVVALTELRQTLFDAPFHRRARESLVPTLLGLGLHAEAVEFAQHLRASSAEDPYAHLAAGAAHALNGDRDAAGADFGSIGKMLGEAAKPSLDAWTRELAVLANAPNDLLAAVLDGREDIADAAIGVLRAVAALAAGVEFETAAGERRMVRFRLPPALARGYSGVVQAVTARLGGGDAEALSAREHESLRVLIDDSLRRRPDGFRYFLRAVLSFQSAGIDQVIRDLDAAVNTPSIVRIGRAAAFLGVRAQVFALRAGPPAPERGPERAALRALVLRILADGPVDEAGYPILLEAAAAAHDEDLGVELVARWRRLRPQSRPPEALRGWLEGGLQRQQAWLRGR